MADPLKSNFECPECGAKYKQVRIRKPPEVHDRAVVCGHCTKPLAPREGEFLLLYRIVGRLKNPKEFRSPFGRECRPVASYIRGIETKEAAQLGRYDYRSRVATVMPRIAVPS
jgi:uncharacterized CHY-type Zn-finger protein